MKREPKKERENDVNINQKTQTHARTHFAVYIIVLCLRA